MYSLCYVRDEYCERKTKKLLHLIGVNIYSYYELNPIGQKTDIVLINFAKSYFLDCVEQFKMLARTTTDIFLRQIYIYEAILFLQYIDVLKYAIDYTNAFNEDRCKIKMDYDMNKEFVFSCEKNILFLCINYLINTEKQVLIQDQAKIKYLNTQKMLANYQIMTTHFFAETAYNIKYVSYVVNSFKSTKCLKFAQYQQKISEIFVQLCAFITDIYDIEKDIRYIHTLKHIDCLLENKIKQKMINAINNSIVVKILFQNVLEYLKNLEKCNAYIEYNNINDDVHIVILIKTDEANVKYKELCESLNSQDMKKYCNEIIVKDNVIFKKYLVDINARYRNTEEIHLVIYKLFQINQIYERNKYMNKLWQ